MNTGTITLRSLEQLRDFDACVELQRETWGATSAPASRPRSSWSRRKSAA